MMDFICVQGLECYASVGVNQWEKAKTQLIRVHLKLAWDLKKAAETDNIDHTLNYQTVCERVVQIAQEQHHQLLETLAERIAQALLKDFYIPKLEVEVYKPNILTNAKDVGVMITRALPPS